MMEATAVESANTTQHVIHLGDSRSLDWIESGSVHLVLTSPPYWTLKEYPIREGQLGAVASYDEFHDELEKVWKHCFRVLVPGGRLVCVVGDVCLSRKKHGRHSVMPMHADIIVRTRKIGFDNLSPIFWHKISNAAYEVENGSAGFLGKPYEPNAIIKNDVEFILMLRKPGGYRQPTEQQRVASKLSEGEYQQWFQQVWYGLTGESTKEHPAPILKNWHIGWSGCSPSPVTPCWIRLWVPEQHFLPRRAVVETASVSKSNAPMSRWPRTASKQSSAMYSGRDVRTSSSIRVIRELRHPRLARRPLGPVGVRR